MMESLTRENGMAPGSPESPESCAAGAVGEGWGQAEHPPP